MGQGWLENIGFVVTDKPGSGEGGPNPIAVGVTGGYFAMTTEEMRAELNRLRAVRDEVERLADGARPLHEMLAPGYDPASTRYTPAGNNSGGYYIGHTGREGQYLNSFIEKMERARLSR